MDDNAKAAMLAVPADLLGADTEKFFKMIIDMYRDASGPSSLDEFVAEAAAVQPDLASAAEEFRDVMTMKGVGSRWPDIAKDFVDEGSPGALVALRREYAAELEAADRPIEDVWADLVAVAGDWSAWDGSDEGWREWSDWFYGQADTQFGGAASAEARIQLGWMEDLTLAEKITALEAIDFRIGAAATAAAAAEQQAADRPIEDVWADLVAVAGDWSAWDGSDEGWREWSDWFYGQADTQFGGAASAEARIQLGWMENLTLAEKITALEAIDFKLGHDLGASAGTAAAADTETPLTPAEFAATDRLMAAMPADEAGVISREDLEQLVRDVPEAASITPEQAAEVFARVKELEASAGAAG